MRLLLALLALWSVPALAISEKQIYCQDVPNDPSPAVMFSYEARNCGGKAEALDHVCTTTSMCAIITDSFLERVKADRGTDFYALKEDQKTKAIVGDLKLKKYPSMITCRGEVEGDDTRCPMLNECKDKREILINPGPKPWGQDRIDAAQKRFDNGDSRFVPVTNEPTANPVK